MVSPDFPPEESRFADNGLFLFTGPSRFFLSVARRRDRQTVVFRSVVLSALAEMRTDNDGKVDATDNHDDDDIFVFVVEISPYFFGAPADCLHGDIWSRAFVAILAHCSKESERCCV